MSSRYHVRDDLLASASLSEQTQRELEAHRDMISRESGSQSADERNEENIILHISEGRYFVSSDL